MTIFLVLAAVVFGAAASSAAAQTPANNPMPDGSRDMYVGLGVVSKPRYEGSRDSERSALPVIQFQWSNGAFVSGLSAGIHLSRTPQVEFGPLLEVQPGRDASGSSAGPVGIEGSLFGIRAAPDSMPPSFPATGPENRLAGMPEIRARLQAGGFLNIYLTPRWRLTGSALYGAGDAHNGTRLDLGVQRLAVDIGARHRVTLGAGLTLVSRSHNAAFFGVSLEDSFSSGNPVYAPGGGLRDVHLGARWNWTLTPSWMLTSQLQVRRLQEDARHSPLVERPTNLTVSTAIAYRF